MALHGRKFFGKQEDWIKPHTLTTMFTERNPCGCHPHDYIIASEYSPRPVSISFKSRQQFTSWLKSYGYVRLDTWAESKGKY